MTARCLALLAASALAAGARGTVGAAAPDQKPWFARALVGMEIDPTGSEFGIGPGDTNYASRYDGREVVRRCKQAGGEYVVVWARDGEYTYYDSKLQVKAPGLGPRDVLREAAEEGRKLGVVVIAYCTVQYCTDTLRQHPEWRMVASDGKPFGRVCFRSGYIEYVKPMLAEILAYGIDGVVLDMLDQGMVPPYGCWCETCQRQFRNQYGRPIPRHPTWDEDWDHFLEFRYASSDLFEQELTRYIRRLAPRATVYFNYHGTPPFSWEVGQRPVQHAINGDFVTGETGLWNYSAVTVGLNAECYRAATPGRPFQAAMQRGVRGYFDQTTRPLNDLRWELFTLLAHGAFVTLIDKAAFDGALDPVAYDRFRLLFAEAHAKQAHFGQPPAPEVGLYFSSRTRDWFGRDQASDYFLSLQGAQKAMVYEHIPWGLLHQENLTLAGLRQFPIVCLPDAAILSEGEIQLLRRYAEEGGNLIVTGGSGTLDWRGGKQTDSSLSELIGAHLVSRLESQDNWLSFPAARSAPRSPLQGDLPADWPFLVKGPAVVYQPTTAVTVGELLKPCRTLSQEQQRHPDPEWLLSPGERVGPGILVNRFGRGLVVAFAVSPDYATASELHIVEARKLLRYAVRFLNPKPLVDISAPATVEAIVTDDPAQRALRVHLLGYNSPPQTTPATHGPYVVPGLIEEAPFYQATLTVNRPFRRASALNPSTVLRRRGDCLGLTVHDIHEVVVIQ